MRLMRRDAEAVQILVLASATFLTFCCKQNPVPRENERGKVMHHPVFDFARWRRNFPIETFEKKEGPRQFDTTKPGDPLDLWKASGQIITSPAHLCEVELIRERVRAKHDLGEAVPVDIFVWRYGPPDKPYLTKIGGVPHRERSAPWPTGKDGKPFTFVAQFCFADSRDIVSDKIPNDVMLIFFRDSNSFAGGPEWVRLEWTPISLRDPIRKEDCPAPAFPVPELSGEIHRCNEYPDSWDVFEQEGHYSVYLLVTSQSTKIGRETFFIQSDPRDLEQELICALSSIQTAEIWPFTNMERLPEVEKGNNEHYGWGPYEMMFHDVGCMFFMIDGKGRITWDGACY